MPPPNPVTFQCCFEMYLFREGTSGQMLKQYIYELDKLTLRCLQRCFWGFYVPSQHRGTRGHPYLTLYHHMVACVWLGWLDCSMSADKGMSLAIQTRPNLGFI